MISPELDYDKYLTRLNRLRRKCKGKEDGESRLEIVGIEADYEQVEEVVRGIAALFEPACQKEVRRILRRSVEYCEWFGELESHPLTASYLKRQDKSWWLLKHAFLELTELREQQAPGIGLVTKALVQRLADNPDLLDYHPSIQCPKGMRSLSDTAALY
jgi:hypothetical protein